MELIYTLTFEDIKSGLLASGKLKNRKSTGLIQSALAILLASFYVYNIINNPSNVLNYIIVFVCIMIIPVTMILPEKTMNKHIKTAVDGNEIKLVIKNDHIDVCVDNNNVKWTANNENIIKVIDRSDTYVFMINNGRILIVPKRILCTDLQTENMKLAIEKIEQAPLRAEGEN